MKYRSHPIDKFCQTRRPQHSDDGFDVRDHVFRGCPDLSPCPEVPAFNLSLQSFIGRQFY